MVRAPVVWYGVACVCVVWYGGQVVWVGEVWVCVWVCVCVCVLW